MRGLVYRKSDGLLLGAQAVGEEGAERRIDVIAIAIQKEGTVFDLEEAELCYAPQFGSAKDAVNIAGMVAANVVRGDVELASWSEVGETDAVIVDVREPAEFERGCVPGAVNVPLSCIRERFRELPRNREIWGPLRGRPAVLLRTSLSVTAGISGPQPSGWLHDLQGIARVNSPTFPPPGGASAFILAYRGM